MVSHNFPRRVASLNRRVWSAGAGDQGHGPLRVQLHFAPRCQGAGVDSRALPRSPRPRRVRGPLLLSDPRPASARRRGKRTAQGDRQPDWALSALFGRAGGFLGGALRHERDAEDRRRGEGDPLRCAQEPCRDRRGGLVRGLGHKFQIWEPERFRAQLAEATEKVRALRKQLGSRRAADDPHGARG